MNTKVGRNDPCPCGSGKKYKNCCYGKDEKKTYTPTGKRKFKAKVLSMTEGAKNVFNAMASSASTAPTTMPSFDSLMFRVTGSDYRAKPQEKNEKTSFQMPAESSKKPEEVTETLPLFGNFTPTTEDFRTKKDEEDKDKS